MGCLGAHLDPPAVPHLRLLFPVGADAVAGRGKGGRKGGAGNAGVRAKREG